MTPTGYTGWLDKQLAGAGRPKAWPLARLVTVKPLLALAGAVLGIFAYVSDHSALKFALMLGLPVLFYFVPDILVRNYAEKRRAEIKLELPNALDQMLISVQAGLGFESAMARAGETAKGLWQMNSSGPFRTFRWGVPAKRRTSLWPNA